MTQRYVPPTEVEIPSTTRSSKLLRKIIWKDGLIVPILVKNNGDKFVAADESQAERVLTCQELGFSTILIEDHWSKEDL
jgi:hypothetical protein